MKRFVTIILPAILIAALLLSSCTSRGVKKLDPDKIVSVEAANAIYSSYLYVIEDKEGIRELVKLYNSVKYTELYEDEEAPDLLMDTLYWLRFSDKDKTVADICISPDGYMVFGDNFDHVYRLTSKFDEANLKSTIDKYNKLK